MTIDEAAVRQAIADAVGGERLQVVRVTGTSATAVIDAGGLLGQVIATTPATATVLLVTDPDHAVPVMVARSGVRLVVYGTGRSDRLQLADVPLSADVREGDELLTSGLGSRFPPGFAVGRVAALRADDSRAFLEADVIPAAQLDRGRDVLLLRGYQPPLPACPPAPAATGKKPAAVVPAAGTCVPSATPPAPAPTPTPAGAAPAAVTPTAPAARRPPERAR